MNEFVIASFRSRTQVIAFSQAMKSNGIKNEIISTPYEISVGCGLSVKFPKAFLSFARSLVTGERGNNFSGFYYAYDDGYGVKLLRR